MIFYLKHKYNAYSHDGISKIYAVFGDAHAHQSPSLASIAVIWFRYHNYIAKNLEKHHPNWRDQELFQKARKITIATWQVCRP